jgi:hypothetical protein
MMRHRYQGNGRAVSTESDQEREGQVLWIAWVLLGAAVVAILAWMWQLDDRSRDADRILKEIREIVLRLETQRDAES